MPLNIRAAKRLQKYQCCFWMMKTTTWFHSCFATNLKPLALVKPEILHMVLRWLRPVMLMCGQLKRQQPTLVPLKNLSDKKILQGSDIRLWVLSHMVLNILLSSIYNFKTYFLLKSEKRRKTSKLYCHALYGLNHSVYVSIQHFSVLKQKVDFFLLDVPNCMSPCAETDAS